jgi:hypothetical protein
MELKSSNSKHNFSNVCCSKATEIAEADLTEAQVERSKQSNDNRLVYGIEDNPAFYLCFLFGLQVTCKQIIF